VPQIVLSALFIYYKRAWDAEAVLNLVVSSVLLVQHLLLDVTSEVIRMRKKARAGAAAAAAAAAAAEEAAARKLSAIKPSDAKKTPVAAPVPLEPSPSSGWEPVAQHLHQGTLETALQQALGLLWGMLKTPFLFMMLFINQGAGARCAVEAPAAALDAATLRPPPASSPSGMPCPALRPVPPLRAALTTSSHA